MKGEKGEIRRPNKCSYEYNGTLPGELQEEAKLQMSRKAGGNVSQASRTRQDIRVYSAPVWKL
jgi:hypothetical protein